MQLSLLALSYSLMANMAHLLALGCHSCCHARIQNLPLLQLQPLQLDLPPEALHQADNNVSIGGELANASVMKQLPASLQPLQQSRQQRNFQASVNSQRNKARARIFIHSNSGQHLSQRAVALFVETRMKVIYALTY